VIRPGAPWEEPFRGTVTAAALSGRALRHGLVVRSEGEASLIGGERMSLDVSLISAEPLRFWTTIFAIHSGYLPPGGRPVIRLDLVRRDLNLEFPSRATKLRLWGPRLSLADGMPAHAGVAVRIAGWEAGKVIGLSSRYSGTRHATELALSPALGWSMLVPWPHGYGIWVRLLTGLWLAGLALPIGYWALRCPRPTWGAGVVGVTVTLGLGIVPALGGYPPVHWSEWVAAALALPAGWAGVLIAAYLERRCASPSANAFSSS
jgi:hypothetical protein